MVKNNMSVKDIKVLNDKVIRLSTFNLARKLNIPYGLAMSIQDTLVDYANDKLAEEKTGKARKETGSDRLLRIIKVLKDGQTVTVVTPEYNYNIQLLSKTPHQDKTLYGVVFDYVVVEEEK